MTKPAVPRRRPPVPILGLAVGGAAAVLTASLLPWRHTVSGPQPLLELADRAPWVALCYLLATLAAVGSVVATVGSTRLAGAAALPLALAALAVLAALVGLLTIPLPTGRVYGGTPDGEMFEYEVPSLRSWGGYLSVAGAVVCFVATVAAARLRRRLVGSRV